MLSVSVGARRREGAGVGEGLREAAGGGDVGGRGEKPRAWGEGVGGGAGNRGGGRGSGGTTDGAFSSDPPGDASMQPTREQGLAQQQPDFFSLLEQ